MPRAPFIVIEGLDRSGKTTQTSLLYKRLESLGKPVKLIKFPDRTTPIGKMIDAYLRSESELDDHVIHLLFSANRWELANTIQTALTSGTTIICDRYTFSGVSFSASKGLPLEWCRSPDISLPSPDLTIFLDISPEKAKERGGYGEERYEKEEMQAKVRKVFALLGKEQEEQEKEGGGRWRNIDAGQEQDIVAEEIWGHVVPLIDGVESSIQRLWEDK